MVMSEFIIYIHTRKINSVCNVIFKISESRLIFPSYHPDDDRPTGMYFCHVLWHLEPDLTHLVSHKRFLMIMIVLPGSGDTVDKVFIKKSLFGDDDDDITLYVLLLTFTLVLLQCM